MLFDIAAVSEALQPGFKLVVETGKFSLTLRDDDDLVLGSVEGYLTSTWALVSRLEVAEPLRRTGVGARIIQQLEELAASCGCRTCHINMFEFSARGFFESHGYVALPADEKNQGDVPRLYLAKNLPVERVTLIQAA